MLQRPFWYYWGKKVQLWTVYLIVSAMALTLIERRKKIKLGLYFASNCLWKTRIKSWNRVHWDYSHLWVFLVYFWSTANIIIKFLLSFAQFEKKNTPIAELLRVLIVIHISKFRFIAYEKLKVMTISSSSFLKCGIS